MRKLLSANLTRLWMNKAFWLTVIFMAMGECLFYLLLLRNGPIPMDFPLFLSLQGIGVLVSVFFSLFLGTEYSDGTIRNKLVVGHRRSSIYLANYMTGIVAVTVIYAAGVLTGGVMGFLFGGDRHYGIGQIVLAGLIGLLACVSYISIFNLIGMLSSSKARTAIICILTAFMLILSGMIFFNLTQNYSSSIYQFLFDFNPLGQTAQAMMIDVAAPWKLAAYALLLSSVLTGVGLYVFRKKDLK